MVLALCLSACQFGLSPSQRSALDVLNRDRAANGAAALPDRLSDVQTKAQLWAEKLVRERSLHHSTLTDSIRTRWCAIGENVAYGSSVSNNEAAFMASSHHRATLLSHTYNGVGVGVARNGATVWTALVFIRSC